MNDPAQQVNDTNTNQQPPVQTDQSLQQPTAPAAAPYKEAEPVAISAETPAEFVQPSEVGPSIPKEVAEAGVEAVSEVPSITPQHREIGIEPAKESVPVATQPTGAVTLPQTQKEAEILLKKNSDTRNSFTWLIMSLIRRFQIAYYAQHGKSNEKQTV